MLLACSSAPLHAQNDSAIYLVSYIDATPATQGQVAAVLKELAAESRKGGALRADLLQRTTEPNQFVVLETWKDQPALDAYNNATTTRQLRDKLTPLLLAPVDQRLCLATTTAPQGERRATLYVVTHIDVGPPGRETAAGLLQQYAAENRKDPGNVRYDVVAEKAKGNHFTVMAAWADQKSADDNQVAAHTKAFRTKIAPLIGALYDQRWYKVL